MLLPSGLSEAVLTAKSATSPFWIQPVLPEGSMQARKRPFLGFRFGFCPVLRGICLAFLIVLYSLVDLGLGHESQAELVHPRLVWFRTYDLAPVSFLFNDFHDRSHEGLVAVLGGVVRGLAHKVDRQVDNGPAPPFPGGDLGGRGRSHYDECDKCSELSHINDI